MSSHNRALSLIDDAIKFIDNYKFSTKATQMDDSKERESDIKWSGKRVRETFVSFFEKKHGHTFVPSSPVVPIDDPTLLFTNAGMNQFKPIFLGTMTKDDELYNVKRAVNSQKCIRAGGKHNDLDDVGKDTYHHTFFEMLGNWSFGDYFKKEAIACSWELLVDVYGLNPDHIYASYFGGHEASGLEPDLEAKEIWLQYLPASHVLPFGLSDNFWEMGATGPCGPCSEIHYDRLARSDGSAAALVNADDPTVIEIWNNVFIQFNRDESGELHLLPDKHVDTGMGFERLTSILQNKLSNYDTDVFMPIISTIQEVTGCPQPYRGKIGIEDKNNGHIDMAYRVVADHIRTLTFAITDGAQPDSTGRDYVIRRVLRRGIRYGSQILGGDTGFFSKLVDCVVQEMGHAFPEIAEKDNIDRVKQIIGDEEALFNKTVKNGETRFQKMAQKCKDNNIMQISGRQAFLLQSTFGFPIDLTVLMAEEHGLTVNLPDFEKALEVEKLQSRQGALGGSTLSDRYIALDANQLDYLKKNKIVNTDSSFKYKWEHIDSSVLAMFTICEKKKTVVPDKDGEKKSDSNESIEVTSYEFGKFVTSASEDEYVGVIVDRTSFYHESGGQVSDEGNIDDIDTNGQTMSFKVDSVQLCGVYDVHFGMVSYGEIKVGSKYQSKVNYDYRSKVAPNHTMTHVLNYALRQTLGNNCDQKGSICDSDKARFDFGHSRKMTVKEIGNAQQIVQDIIKKNLKVHTQVLDKDKAFSISSLRAMFGEKYPQNVRVVSIGVSPSEAVADPSNKKWFDFSIELCGGTHLRRTGEAGDFLIISEEPLSAGVRRIVAYTGEGAKKAQNEAKILRNRLESALKMKSGNQVTMECTRLNGDLREARISALEKEKLTKLLGELNTKDKKYKKQLAGKLKDIALEQTKGWIEDVKNSNGKVEFLVKQIDVGLNSGALKAVVKLFHKECNNIPIVLFSGAPNETKNKVIVKVEIPKKFDNAKAKLSAKEWLNQVTPLLQAKGGGNDKAATAQGASMDNIATAIKLANQYGETKLQSARQ